LHNSTSNPSALFYLVVLALLHRLRPKWVAIGVTQAARAEGINPERVSRLCTRALSPWQAVLSELVQRGRPAVQPNQEAELSVLRALLSVATSLLGHVNLSRPALKVAVVGAWLRLHSEHPRLSQQRFCEAVALAPRTLRSWLVQPKAFKPNSNPPPAQPDPKPRRQRIRGPRRPRFRFDLVVPGTQMGTDTTDLSVFGVPLKLMAAQDIGHRDAQLFDSVLVSDHEDSELIMQVLTQALAERKGMQVISDQGTPYMAEATRECIEQQGAEHVPQREGDPLGKATVERAFRTVKDIAAPIFQLTNRIADTVPELGCLELAQSVGRLLIVTLLRAYQAGARATRRSCEQRSHLDEASLERVAERAREQARADDNSKRLFLTEIHQMYAFPDPIQKFIRMFRRYPLPVLKQAEVCLRSQLHRDDIRSLSRYFGSIVRREHDLYWAERKRRDRVERERLQAAAQAREEAAIWRARHTNPCQWLREALEALAAHWLPKEQQLLFGGLGIGIAWMQGALARMVTVHGATALQDLAHGVMHDFARAHHERLGQRGVEAIEAVLEKELRALPSEPRKQTPTPSGCSPGPSSAILWNIGQLLRPFAQNSLPI
jgi:transposase InsO family protein